MHGIIGDGQSTWTNGKAYWPSLISEDKDFDDADIYVYEYPTSAFGNALTINEIAENMRLTFDADGVSSHANIVFLAHSMGGIVVRNYLLKYRNIASRVRMIYFFSTPTTGSQIASVMSLLIKDPQLSKLRISDSADYLADVQRDWLAANFTIPSYCAYEKRPTYGVLVVTQESATNLCNRALDPIDADHISIVKPSGVRDFSYLAFGLAYREAKSRAAVSPGRLTLLRVTNAAEPPSTDASPYLLRAIIRLSFGTKHFNRPSYFAGLTHPKILDLPESEDRANVFPNQASSARGDSLDFEVLFYLHHAPDQAKEVVFSVGPRKWKIAFGSLTWLPTAKNDTRFWASAELELIADDPDWVVLSDSRFLRVQSRNKKGTDSMLETVIENLTPITLAMTNLVISASGGGLPLKCAAAPNENSWEPPTETLVLNWPRIVKKQGAARSTDGAWVKLGEDRVSLKAAFQEQTCLSLRSFSVFVPINLSIPPRETGRVRLTVSEMPQLERLTDRSISIVRQDPIPPLYAWPSVQVSIEPDAFVYPRSINARY